MKDPRIVWPRREAQRQNILNAIGSLTKGDVDNMIIESIAAAEEMATVGIDKIQEIILMNRSRWKRTWNNDDLLVQWFGKVQKASHVKNVHKRLGKVHNRIANHVLAIRVRPARRGSAQNLGTFLSPKTFMIRPAWIMEGQEERAGTIIHELLHEWFLDQKLDGETVYGDELAMRLASENPKKARKSAENYAQYCMDVE